MTSSDPEYSSANYRQDLTPASRNKIGTDTLCNNFRCKKRWKHSLNVRETKGLHKCCHDEPGGFRLFPERLLDQNRYWPRHRKLSSQGKHFKKGILLTPEDVWKPCHEKCRELSMLANNKAAENSFYTIIKILLLVLCSVFLVLVLLALYYARRSKRGYQRLPQSSPELSTSEDNICYNSIPLDTFTINEVGEMDEDHDQMSSHLPTTADFKGKNFSQKQFPTSGPNSAVTVGKHEEKLTTVEWIERFQQKRQLKPPERNTMPFYAMQHPHHPEKQQDSKKGSNIRKRYAENAVKEQDVTNASKQIGIAKDEAQNKRHPLYLIPVHKWMLKNIAKDTVISLYPLMEGVMPQSLKFENESNARDNREVKSLLTAATLEGKKATSCLELHVDATRSCLSPINTPNIIP